MSNARGKKVFFVYPHSVMEESLVDLLVRNEYEIYLLKDHERALTVFQHFPESVVFINIDERMPEEDWETYIRGLMENERTKQLRLGIISYHQDKALAEKYLMELMVPCGYIALKLGIKESARILLTTLEANEAKGRRKHVRAICSNPLQASFNIKDGTQFFKGTILDISVVGMACIFDNAHLAVAGTYFNDIQLRLKGVPIRVSGKVAGFHGEHTERHVIMFDAQLPAESKRKIHGFIHKQLQEEIQNIINSDEKIKTEPDD